MTLQDRLSTWPETASYNKITRTSIFDRNCKVNRRRQKGNIFSRNNKYLLNYQEKYILQKGQILLKLSGEIYLAGKANTFEIIRGNIFCRKGNIERTLHRFISASSRCASEKRDILTPQIIFWKIMFKNFDHTLKMEFCRNMCHIPNFTPGQDKVGRDRVFCDSCDISAKIRGFCDISAKINSNDIFLHISLLGS